MVMSMRHRFKLRRLVRVGSVLVAPEEIVGVTEIAEMLGVPVRTAGRYVTRADFPAPLGTLKRGRVWRRKDVERWGREHLPLQPGRPRKKGKGTTGGR